MTEEIKIRNLKVTKVQETETETDSGITNKWTYTLQDEEKENTFTLKTAEKRTIDLGDTLDITLGNDQTTLDVHVNSEAEALTEIVDEQGLMDKVVEEIEKRPELADKVKDKLAEYNDLKDKKEALEKILDKAKAAEDIKVCDDCGEQIEGPAIVKEGDLSEYCKNCGNKEPDEAPEDDSAADCEKCTEDEPCEEHMFLEHHRPEKPENKCRVCKTTESNFRKDNDGTICSGCYTEQTLKEAAEEEDVLSYEEWLRYHNETASEDNERTYKGYAGISNASSEPEVEKNGLDKFV